MSEYIYVGFDATQKFKIGITKDYNKRIKQFRTANPTFHYLLVFEVGNASVEEGVLHAKFSNKNYTHEWFDLNPEDLFWIYNRYSKSKRHSLQEFVRVYDIIRLVATDINSRNFLKDYETITD